MEYSRGVWFGVAAYVTWGLSPLFWNLVSTDAISLLLHRILWAVPILALAITVRSRWPELRVGYRTWRSRWTSVAAAALIAGNWGVFLWAVTNGHIVEISLGYFINPLISVVLGVVILKEKLQPLQWTAVGIAAVGVTAMGIIAGVLPWISLTLGLSFGLYGLLKKRIAAPPVISLFGETAVMVVPAMIAMLLIGQPTGNAFGASPGVTLFLIATGLMTVVPLLLFGAAARRIPLSMLGFLQYIAPSIQLFIGVFVFSESLSTVELGGFVAVWIALVVFTLGARGSKNSRRLHETSDNHYSTLDSSESSE